MRFVCVCTLIVLLTGAPAALGQGTSDNSGASAVQWYAPAVPALGPAIALYGVSPVNQSMAGAAVGCPIDSAGAIFWNPATISGLPCSDISLGMQLVWQKSELSSSGPAILYPPSGESGSTLSDTALIPLPSLAFVHKNADSPVAIGMGLFGIGGSKVNYPVDESNPALDRIYALGPLYASTNIMQVVPAISYQLTPNLSAGIGLTATRAELTANRYIIGFPGKSGMFPKDLATREFWGGGFEAGVFYMTDYGWGLGVSYKSRQWMEPIEYSEPGADVAFRFDYPSITSVGISYSGFEQWIIACDVRYFDYASTTGFASGGFDSSGKLNGLEWNNIFAVALGVQRQIGEQFSVRMGYSYNDNPITDPDVVLLNVAQPLITQHAIYTGASFTFADNWIVSVAYAHGFANTISGPITKPNLTPLTDNQGNPVANTRVASGVSLDMLSVGCTKRF